MSQTIDTHLEVLIQANALSVRQYHCDELMRVTARRLEAMIALYGLGKGTSLRECIDAWVIYLRALGRLDAQLRRAFFAQLQLFEEFEAELKKGGYSPLEQLDAEHAWDRAAEEAAADAYVRVHGRSNEHYEALFEDNETMRAATREWLIQEWAAK